MQDINYIKLLLRRISALISCFSEHQPCQVFCAVYQHYQVFMQDIHIDRLLCKISNLSSCYEEYQPYPVVILDINLDKSLNINLSSLLYRISTLVSYYTGYTP